MIGSMLMVISYYLLVLEKRQIKYVYGPGMGSLFMVLNLFLIDKSGASLNVIRVLSNSILSNYYHSLYIHLIGGTIGSLLGGLIGNILLSEKPRKRKSVTVLE